MTVNLVYLCLVGVQLALVYLELGYLVSFLLAVVAVQLVDNLVP